MCVGARSHFRSIVALGSPLKGGQKERAHFPGHSCINLIVLLGITRLYGPEVLHSDMASSWSRDPLAKIDGNRVCQAPCAIIRVVGVINPAQIAILSAANHG